MNYKRPDSKNALSILEAAKREMRFTLTMELTQESSSTIVRNIYECFRMLGDSLLVMKGISSQDHMLPIRELMKLRLNTSRPINLIDSLRILRHNINYYGYRPTMIEAQDAISIAKACFEPIVAEISNRLK